VLAYLRKGETFAELAAGFGIGTATAWRYVTETVGLLAARPPKLRKALARAKQAGHAYVVIDGTLVPIDRVAADRPFCSGKHHRHGMNLQAIASPDGDILWVSGPLPGSVHDLTAARIWGTLRELAASALIVLADKGYHGARDHIRTPYKGRNKPASQRAANSAHAKLRGPGERQRPAQILAHPAQTMRADRRHTLGRRRDIDDRVARPSARPHRVGISGPQVHNQLAINSDRDRRADLTMPREVVGKRLAHTPQT
jgi:DDE superfamily endonuclease/Helix-turn-helix of DDE superfamily endonuclease